jgi:hypothetical protein
MYYTATHGFLPVNISIPHHDKDDGPGYPLFFQVIAVQNTTLGLATMIQTGPLQYPKALAQSILVEDVRPSQHKI